MTNYTVIVQEKGTDGFKVVGHADANTPKQAVEITLLTKSVTEGQAVAVPTRSWNPIPYKLAAKPSLDLG